MKIKAIFYDFDGVIKESTQIKTEAFYALYLPYGEVIAQKAKSHHILHGGISRFEKFKHYHKAFLNIDLKPSQINDLATEFSKIVLQKVIESDYVIGAKESIEKLSKTYLQFIVTGTPQNEIEIILDQLGITRFFDGIFGSPDDKIKISAYLLKTQKLKPNEVVFIGDATTDYNAAKHYNFPFILRSHPENESIFENKNIIKTKDLTNLSILIENL